MPRVRVSPRIAGTIVVLLSALALCAGPASPAQASTVPVPYGFVGMNVNGPIFPPAQGVSLNRELATMEAAGVDAITVDFDWSYAQPYAGAAAVPAAQKRRFTATVAGVPTDFSQTDEIVRLAAAHGITVQPTVIYAPLWDMTHNYRTGPKTDQPYANYLSALVHRYGPHGTFWAGKSVRAPIVQWQIWNEENGQYFWQQQPFAKSYVQLLGAAHRAIKRADPSATVVLGGLLDYSWKSLATLYAVPGARNDFDMVAIHPYTATPAGVITIAQRVRAVMDAHGDGHKPIIVNEFGWDSAAGQTKNLVAPGIDTTASQQAKNIATVLPLLAAERTKLGLAGFDYYTWSGVERHGDYAFDFAGLESYLHGKLTAKPALGAFSTAALAMESCARKGGLATQCATPAGPGGPQPPALPAGG